MATKVYLIPEIGFVQVPDSGTREYLIPEGGFFSEGAGSPDVEVTATCDSLTLTEYGATVTIKLDVSVSAACDELTITEYAATVNAEVSITAETDALTLTTYDATVTFGFSVDCATSELTLTSYAAGIKADTNIAAEVCNLTLSAHKANLSESTTIAATCDTLTLTANTATIRFDVNITTTPDALTITGLSATVSGDVNVSATCDALTLTTKYAVVSFDSHAIIETGWAKDRNLGPWTFNKPPKKYGYQNNPRWVAKDRATTFHKPCGYWPLVYSEVGYYQQSVDMYDDEKIVGAAAIATDGSHYKLLFLNYETDELIKQFDIPATTNRYYGAITITKTPDDEFRIIYINWDGTDLCAFVWDYFSTPHKIVLKTESSSYLSSIANLGNGVLVAKDDSAAEVHTSIDYGTSWTTYDAYGYNILHDGNGRVYLIGTILLDSIPMRAYYSDDYGENWSEIDHGITGDYGDGSTSVYPCVDGDYVYVVKLLAADATIQHIFLSTNKGATWSVITAPLVGGVGILSPTVAAGTKDGVLILEGLLNDDPDYTQVYLRSADDGSNWTQYHLPQTSIVPTLEKTSYWQISRTDAFWLRTYCGLYLLPSGDLAFQVSIDDSLTWMNRSLHIGARDVDYGPDPVWTMPK